MVWRAQQAKDQIERGQSAGKKTNSGGTAGRSSQSQQPIMANQTCVKTRADSVPPCSRTQAEARAMCASAGPSPASRRATYASTVADNSPGPFIKGGPWPVGPL